MVEGLRLGKGPDWYARRLDTLTAQTPESVSSAAKRWLERPVYALTVLHGAPPPTEAAVVRKAPAPLPPAPAAKRTRAPLPPVGAFTDVTFPKAEHARLSNGIEIVYLPNACAPLTELQIEFDVGSVTDQVTARGMHAMLIDRGEAWLQGRKDPGTPFVVSAGAVRVEAVGTAFSVRRRDGGADVMVTEGVVRVWVDGREAGAVRLVAGAALFVSDTAGIRPESTLAPAIERRLAWRSGQINLEGETLGEAVQEFNRYSAIPIVVRDPDVAERRLYGVFRLDDPGGFARTAAVTLGVAAWTEDDRIMIARTRR